MTRPTTRLPHLPGQLRMAPARLGLLVGLLFTATVPAADVTSGVASELNPSGYEFNTNELPDISVISAGAGIVTAAFYA